MNKFTKAVEAGKHDAADTAKTEMDNYQRFIDDPQLRSK